MTSYLRTVVVKIKGRSKTITLPPEWELQDGDWILSRMAKRGDKYPFTLTSRVRSNQGSRYITIPPDWPLFGGDIVDLKVTLADIPRRPIDEVDDDPGERAETEDQTVP